jgi:hypothetical protein
MTKQKQKQKQKQKHAAPTIIQDTEKVPSDQREATNSTPSIREFYENLLSFDRTHYLNTHNPIYVWQALSRLLCPETIAKLQCHQDDHYPPWTGDLPDWVRDYLLGCAKEVDSLRHDILCKGCDSAKSVAKECAKKIPGKFGFVGSKSNAFSRYKTDLENTHIAIEFHDQKEQGVSVQAALEAARGLYLPEEADAPDTRHTRRRKDHGMKLYREPGDK